MGSSYEDGIKSRKFDGNQGNFQRQGMNVRDSSRDQPKKSEVNLSQFWNVEFNSTERNELDYI